MRAWVVTAAAVIPGFVASPGAAQIDADAVFPGRAVGNGDPGAEVARLVAALDAADPLVREEASTRLTTAPELTLKDLERALTGGDGAAPELSPEQRYRLLSAAFRRFKAEPRAAMGVQFDENVREAGIRLNGTVEGFHAHEALRTGDRIETIADLRVRDRAHAVAIIVSHDPGDESEVGIIRDGVPLKVRVRMGARGMLQNAMGLTLDSLNEAWAIRSAGYAESTRLAARVIDCGLASSAWPGQTEVPPRDGPAVSAGGEARGAPDPVLIARAVNDAGRGNRAGRSRRFEQRFDGPFGVEQIAAAIQARRDQAAIIEATMDRNMSLLRDPGLSAPRRTQALQEIEMLRAQLRALEQSITDLQRLAQRTRR